RHDQAYAEPLQRPPWRAPLPPAPQRECDAARRRDRRTARGARASAPACRSSGRLMAFYGGNGELGTLALGLVIAGVVGGLVAGMLGVGGGIVVVPILYHVLAALGVDP